jgi:RNA polymerase-binding protein DksA
MAPAKRPYSKKELQDFKSLLVEERSELERQFDELEESALGASQSELSGEAAFDEEYADSGTFTFERERDLSLAENLRDLMEQIDHALQRIEAGTFGICERCGKPIEKARMKALPYARLCIKDKQAEERTH